MWTWRVRGGQVRLGLAGRGIGVDVDGLAGGPRCRRGGLVAVRGLTVDMEG